MKNIWIFVFICLLSTKKIWGQQLMKENSALQLEREIQGTLVNALATRVINESSLLNILTHRTKIYSAFPDVDDKNLCRDKIQNMIQKFTSNDSIQSYIQALLLSGKGLNQFGDYFNCRDSPISTFIMFEILVGTHMAVGIGLCGPIECQENDYMGLQEPIYNYIEPLLAPIFAKFNLVMTIDMLQFVDIKERNEKLLEYKAGNILTIIFYSLLLATVVIATTVDYFKNQRPKEPLVIARRNLEAANNPSEINENPPNRPLVAISAKQPWYMTLLYCFNATSNAKAILYSKNRSDPNLDILNGVRVLSMGWVITGHALMMSVSSPTLNYNGPFELLGRSYGMSIFTAGTVSVDVFFALSGFLAVYSFSGELIKPGLSPIQKIKLIFHGYLHRYIRLLAIYAITILAAMYILPLTYDSVLTPDLSINVAGCEDNWWKNFLYVNNIWDTNMCMTWTWYLSNDMQFFLVAPWLAWLYIISKKLAILVTFGMIIISMLIQSIIISYYNIGMAFIGQVGPFTYYYFRPWCRINTYFVGILFVWLYLSYKKREFRYGPLELINQILQKPLIRYTSFLIGLGLCTLVVYITGLWYVAPVHITEIDNVFYGILHRVGFVLGVFLIIYPVLLDNFKPLLRILGNEIFNALARITYGAYMFHLLVLTFIISSDNQAMYFTVEYIIFLTIDIFLVSYIISFMVGLLLESPMLGIEKYFLLPRRRPVQSLQSPPMSPPKGSREGIQEEEEEETVKFIIEKPIK